jgi:hypothetical protein
MERACRPSCGLQAGAASGEDEDRLLQGCEPARRLSYHLVRLSGFSISSPDDDLKWKGGPRLHARRQSESVDGHQPNGSALVASSSQRQVPAGAGRDVQLVHSRLDHLLQPLLQDAVASGPEEDRCLCRSLKNSAIVTSEAGDGLEETGLLFKAEGNAPSLRGRSVDELFPNRVRLPDPIQISSRSCLIHAEDRAAVAGKRRPRRGNWRCSARAPD